MTLPATCWEDAYRTQVEAAIELRAENAELRATLDLLMAADERAVDAWRAAHPGTALVLPDRAALVVWLLGQNAALRVVAVEVCAVARVWATVWGDKLSAESLERFAELERQILNEPQPSGRAL
jgi:hypothetical protein